MKNLLDELYQKDTQTRIATGGARGIDPVIVENAREAELSAMNQKAAVQAGMAENIRQNKVEEKLQSDYIKDTKTAQNLNAVAMLGTTYLGSRKPAVSQEQQFKIKPVFLIDSIFDVPLITTDQNGNRTWNTELFSRIWS